MIHPEHKLYLFGFSSPEEERAFRYSHHNPKDVRKIILFCILVFTLYLIQDYFLFPEYFSRIFFIRAGLVLPLTFLFYSLTYSRYYKRFSAFIITGLAIANGGGIILIEYLVRDNPYAEMYFYGIAQVLMVYYGTGKVRFLPSLVCGLCIAVPAVFVDAVYVETDIHRIITKSIFIAGMLVLGTIVSLIIQHTARSRFLSHRKVEILSMTDTLTGLKNRLYYRNIIVDEILKFINIDEGRGLRRGERSSDTAECSCHAFILMDLDHFKRINDNYGHEAGDEVLIEFSKRVLSVIRSDDDLIRWGGEEFLLILRNSRKDNIEKLVNRIRHCISEQPFLLDEISERITVSGGIHLIFPDSAEGQESAAELINSADKALYYSKENGRNCFTQSLVEGRGLKKKESFQIVSNLSASESGPV